MSNLSNTSFYIQQPTKPALLSDYLSVVSGIMTLCSNLILIFILMRAKREKTNFIRNVLHLAAADAFLGLSSISRGLYRINIVVNSMKINKNECLVQQYFWISAMIVCNSQTFCMGLDRLLAVLIPTIYQNRLSGWKMQIINVSQWLVILSVFAVGAIKFQLPTDIIPICIPDTVFTETFSTAFMSLVNAYAVATALMYLAILVTVKVRLRLVRKQKGNVKMAKREMETKVLATVGFIVIFYAIMILGSGLAAHILLQYPSRSAIVALTCMPLLVVFNGTANVLIYLWKNEVVREEFAAVFCRKVPHPTVTGDTTNRRVAWTLT